MISYLSKLLQYFFKSQTSSEKSQIHISLPNSIIYYIAKNPSTPKLYQKLIKTSKYFYAKNPILFLYDVYFDDQWCIWHGFNRSECKYEIVNINKISSKIWLNGNLTISPKLKHVQEFSYFFQKLYRTDTIKSSLLEISNQTINFNDLFPNYSFFEKISFKNVTVKNDDGTLVSLKKIISHFSKVKRFYYKFGNQNVKFSNDTVENLLQIPHFSNITEFTLENISDSLNIEKFYDYLKTNKKLVVTLEFNNTISEQYKNRLEAIIDKILGVPITADNYINMTIIFPGLARSKKCKMIFNQIERIFFLQC